MIVVNYTIIWLLILGWISPLAIYGNPSNQKTLFVIKLANGNWLPNTVIPEGASASFYKGYWYSYCEGGIIRLNQINSALSVIPLPKIKSEYPRISGIAIANKTLWVSMMRDDGILVFDLDQQSFGASISVAKGVGFGEGNNLNIIQDSFNEKIWISSFNHLDVYDKRTGLWKNLDPVFWELGIGTPSSDHWILPDGDIVWINAPAHNYSRGGLIRLDLGNNKNTVFRKELVGLDCEFDMLIIMSLLSSPNYLWVYSSLGNGYNFYVSVYDKKNNSWKSYNRSAILPAIELLIKELPYVKWQGRNFLVDISWVDPFDKTHINHPFLMKPEQIKSLRSGLNKLSEAYKKYNINAGYYNYGLYDYSIYGSMLYGKNNPWGEMKPIKKINFPQIRYERLIGSNGGFVVMETNEGLGIFDPEKNTVQYLSPLTKLRADELDIWWSIDKKKAIIREFISNVHDGGGYNDFKSLDFDNLKINSIKMIDEPEAKAFKSIPKNTVLIDNKEIILQWDGLLIKPLN